MRLPAAFLSRGQNSTVIERRYRLSTTGSYDWPPVDKTRHAICHGAGLGAGGMRFGNGGIGGN
jgi:hypothetical protein